MKNIKTIRKKNAEFLAQLLVDQKFYTIKLAGYDEDSLRKKVSELKKKRDDELQRVNGLIKVQKRNDKRPTQEDMKDYLRLDKELKEIEKVVNDYENLKQGQEKGKKSIEDVSRILEIIDNLSGQEKHEINNL